MGRLTGSDGFNLDFCSHMRLDVKFWKNYQWILLHHLPPKVIKCMGEHMSHPDDQDFDCVCESVTPVSNTLKDAAKALKEAKKKKMMEAKALKEAENKKRMDWKALKEAEREKRMEAKALKVSEKEKRMEAKALKEA